MRSLYKIITPFFQNQVVNKIRSLLITDLFVIKRNVANFINIYLLTHTIYIKSMRFVRMWASMLGADTPDALINLLFCQIIISVLVQDFCHAIFMNLRWYIMLIITHATQIFYKVPEFQAELASLHIKATHTMVRTHFTTFCPSAVSTWSL